MAKIIYEKSSFDRFGDDLAEVLLSSSSASGLTLEDRIRLESVSRQWQRTMFTGITRLEIDHKFYNKNRLQKNIAGFESLLKKLPNIQSIEFNCLGFNDQISDTIVNHCPNLRSIKMQVTDDLSVEAIGQFFDRFGQQLRAIKCTTNSSDESVVDQFVDRLQKCGENIVDLNVRNFYNYYERRSDFALIFGPNSSDLLLLFTKLRNFSFMYRLDDRNRVQQFARHYGKCSGSLRKIDVLIDENCDQLAVETLMQCLGQLTVLSDLAINFDTIDAQLVESIPELMIKIGRKPSLRKFSLKLHMYSKPLTSQLLSIINENFSGVEFIKFYGNFPAELCLMDDSLRNCRQLRGLWLHFAVPFYLDNQYVQSIAEKFPKLQYLYLKRVELDDRSLDYQTVAKLRHLNTLTVFYCRQQLDTKSLMDKIISNNSKTLKNIDIKFENFMVVNNFVDQLFNNYKLMKK